MAPDGSSGCPRSLTPTEAVAATVTQLDGVLRRRAGPQRQPSTSRPAFWGGFLRDVMAANSETANFPRLRSRRDGFNRLSQVLEVTGKAWAAEILQEEWGLQVESRRSGDEILSEHTRVRPLAGGLSAHRSARTVLVLRGVHPHHRLDVQPAREVAQHNP